MATTKRFVTYSKKTGKFVYDSMTIGGTHFVKDEIATLIKEQLPAKLSKKIQYTVEVQRAGRTYYYAVTLTA